MLWPVALIATSAFLFLGDLVVASLFVVKNSLAFPGRLRGGLIAFPITHEPQGGVEPQVLQVLQTCRCAGNDPTA